MSELQDLKESLSTMSDEELHEMFREIRLNRRKAASSPAKKSTAKAKSSLDVSSFSAEDAQALLNLIGGDDES